MNSPILKIKTIVPPLGKNLISRPKILESIDKDLIIPEGFNRHLTLISAPAGFGKTTLVRSWIGLREREVAWFSMDKNDNDVERFWIYLITALQGVNKDIGKGPLEVFRSSQHINPIPTEALLITLLNDLLALSEPIYLVLDDYHLIEDSEIHEGIIFIIENAPPTFHLVVTTRSDPPWPLSRWRASGRMMEIRVKELEFSIDEADLLFKNTKDIELNEDQLISLCSKTEGWVTGLKLAATSLSHSNISEFINNFAGGNRHVLDFLMEEVFSKQPDEVKEFLLKTSILDRLCSSLCNAVTEMENCSEQLAKLERENLFLIPLDDQGTWYRYHVLFSDLLSHHLTRKYSEDEISSLHDKAAKWFLEAEAPSEALRHTFLSKNLEKMADLLHNHDKVLLKSGGPGQFIRSLETISLESLIKYPRLAAYKAFYLLLLKGKDEVEDCIKLAEQAYYEDDNQQKEYEGIVAAIKVYYYVYNHSFKEAIESAEIAMKRLPQNDYFWRMGVAVFSGDTKFFSGNPKESYPYYLEAHQRNQQSQLHYFSISTGLKIAINLYYLGKLREAKDIIKECLNTAKEAGLSKISKVGAFWALKSEILREEGDFKEADRCIERGLYLSQTEKPYLAWNNLSKISLCFSKGEYNEAINYIRQIEGINHEVSLPFYITLSATIWETRILLSLGEIVKARDLLSKVGVAEDGIIQEGLDEGYLVLIKVLLLDDENLNKVCSFLDTLLENTSKKGHIKLYLEALLLKANLNEKQELFDEAESTLLTALKLGLECGFFQQFVNESERIAQTLERIIKNIGCSKKTFDIETTNYLSNIYHVISKSGENIKGLGAFSMTKQNKDHISSNGLIEELTQRELEILNLISLGLTNQSIAEKLFLSLGTVKWYTSNIYGKLGVRSRTQAIAAAVELSLLKDHSI